MCPKGDDPMTLHQNFRKIHLAYESPTIHEEEGTGYELGLEFMGHTLYFDVRDPNVCPDAFANKGPFGNIGCDEIVNNDNYNWYKREFSMSFYSWPTYPKDTNLYFNDGNPSIYDFGCDLSTASGYDKQGYSKCVFTDVVSENIAGKHHP